MNDVAIIGVGLHPFGRFEGKSAMEMGVDAILAAVADAGVEWKDIQFATGGSWTVANPDAIVGMVGLTGIPFTNVFNACATAASAAKACADGIRLGDYDIGIAIGLDKHPRGAFTEDPALVGMPSWYAENGQYLTTKFFGMKANRYLHDHGISQETLARVAAKNFRNGALNPNAFRRKPIPEDEILNSTMLNYPLTQYMFCAPDEGAAAVVMCRADIAHRYTSKPVYLRAVEVRTRKYGAYEVNTTFAPSTRTWRRPCTRPSLRSKRPVSHRRTSTSSSCRTPTPARRSFTWPSAVSAPPVSRRSCWPTAPPRFTARCRSTPTAG
jgi:acetyl-CoA C-acetyltransferase